MLAQSPDFGSAFENAESRSGSHASFGSSPGALPPKRRSFKAVVHRPALPLPLVAEHRYEYLS